MRRFVPKRQKLSEAVVTSVASNEQNMFFRAQREVSDLPTRVGGNSNVYRELFDADPERCLEDAEADVLFGVIMARLQPRIVLDYIK